MTNVAYYKTQAQAEANVNRLYRNGVMGRYTDFGSAYHISFAGTNDILTGYFINAYEGQEILDQYSRKLERQKNTMQLASSMDGVWDNCYQAINVANGAIKYIPTIPMDEATATRLTAEAKFFRGWNYYYLVKTFGAVPFYTEPYETAENMEIPRTETATIYAQIENDLKEAMSNLPAATFSANAHRITKYVAAAVLTDAYMMQGKYAEAAETAKVIINSAHKLTANDDLAMGSA